MTRLPKNRAPTHPGEILLEDFINGHGLTQTDAASRLGISYPRLNEIVNGKRGITTDTAIRLARLFETTAEFWLNGQRDWELWHTLHSPAFEEIERIEPVHAHV
ncbi:MAG TPA: HigA family addiction module antitoxin [Longimicrobium sp.]|jgi:addiction module HigA family antidote